jgi:hypothetical protein
MKSEELSFYPSASRLIRHFIDFIRISILLIENKRKSLKYEIEVGNNDKLCSRELSYKTEVNNVN